MPDITQQKAHGKEAAAPLLSHSCRERLTLLSPRGPGAYGKSHRDAAGGKNNRPYVLHAIFCQTCAPEKGTTQVGCWQMPERVYRNFSEYGVEPGSGWRFN